MRNPLSAHYEKAGLTATLLAALGFFCGGSYAADTPVKENPQQPRVAPQRVAPPPRAAPEPRAAPAPRNAPQPRVAPPPRGAPQAQVGAAARAGGAAGRVPNINSPGGRPTGNVGAGRERLPPPNRQVQARPVPPSREFVGHPGPAGTTERHAANGAVFRQRPNGSLLDIHDPKRGMDIHRGVNGDRRVVVTRPDRSRVYAGRGGNGYVQHPYAFRGREFGRRTYFVNGRVYDRFYRHYPYHGVQLEVYAPVRYYPVAFYGWAYNPWARPVRYGWGWGGSPWYGHYGYYFAPYPVYASASFWLTDYLIAASLQAAYAARQSDPGPDSGPGPAANGAPLLTPDVKQQIADEVKRQVEQDTAEAQRNQQRPGVEPAGGGIAALLNDNRPHVFVAGSDLDLVDPTGRECMISQGDVVQVVGAPVGAAGTTNAVILASKGGTECAQAASVEIALTDLQEMQNHMRATLDQGMAELQAKQGQGGLPAAPTGATEAPTQAAFAAGAPPPDAGAGSEIAQQAQAADQAEQGVGGDSAAAPADSGSAPAQISLGQSIESVTAILGAPTRIVDLGAKKIYTYPDIKVVFTNGQVSDVQ